MKTAKGPHMFKIFIWFALGEETGLMTTPQAHILET